MTHFSVDKTYFQDGPLSGRPYYDPSRGLHQSKVISSENERLRGLQTFLIRLYQESVTSNGLLYKAFVWGVGHNLKGLEPARLKLLSINEELEKASSPSYLTWIIMRIWNLVASCFGCSLWIYPDYKSGLEKSHINQICQQIQNCHAELSIDSEYDSFFEPTMSDILACINEPNKLYAFYLDGQCRFYSPEESLSMMFGEQSMPAHAHATTWKEKSLLVIPDKEIIFKVGDSKYKILKKTSVFKINLLQKGGNITVDLGVENHKLIKGINLGALFIEGKVSLTRESSHSDEVILYSSQGSLALGKSGSAFLEPDIDYWVETAGEKQQFSYTVSQIEVGRCFVDKIKEPLNN